VRYAIGVQERHGCQLFHGVLHKRETVILTDMLKYDICISGLYDERKGKTGKSRRATYPGSR
jgi:hypothetical protein